MEHKPGCASHSGQNTCDCGAGWSVLSMLGALGVERPEKYVVTPAYQQATPQEGEWPARDAVPMVRELPYKLPSPEVVKFLDDLAKLQAGAIRAAWDDASAFGTGFYKVENGQARHVPVHQVRDTSGRVSAARPVSDIEVTPEMVAAADAVWDDPTPPRRDIPTLCIDIYRAMAALAPVPLVSDGELAAVRERDALDRAVACWRVTAEKYKEERDEAMAEAAWRRRELQVQLAARDARIAELDTLLTQRPAAAPVPPNPAPVIREHRSEPWRMGR